MSGAAASVVGGADAAGAAASGEMRRPWAETTVPMTATKSPTPTSAGRQCLTTLPTRAFPGEAPVSASSALLVGSSAASAYMLSPSPGERLLRSPAHIEL